MKATAKRIAEEAKNLEWRATYTTAAREAALAVEYCEYNNLSKSVRAANDKLSGAVQRRYDSWNTTKSLETPNSHDGVYTPEELKALTDFATAKKDVDDARFELNQIKMARDTWVRKSSDMFKSILEEREKEAVAKREKEDWDEIQNAWMSEDNMRI